MNQICKEILKKKINYDNIMFTDECKINLRSYTSGWIRLEPNPKKIKKWRKRAI